MIAVVVSIAVIIAALCASESVLKRMPRLDAWLDRFIGGNDAPVVALTPEEWSRKHGYMD